MHTTTTFLTATGTTWSLTGMVLTRCGEDVGVGSSYEAVPNAVDRGGQPYVAVVVGSMLTFTESRGGRPVAMTTGRVTQVLRVASARTSAA
jgi:hypothetical protein